MIACTACNIKTEGKITELSDLWYISVLLCHEASKCGNVTITFPINYNGTAGI